MELLLLNFYVFVLAATYALIEIQIEGSNGWAEKLPTWRPDQKLWYVILYKKFLPSKELTGYHILFFTLILLIFHLPFAFGIPLTLDQWLKTLSIIFFFMTLEDFLWFLFNPAFGLGKFMRNEVPWHKKRFLYLPVEYFSALLASFIVIVPIYFINNSVNIFFWWVASVCMLSTLTLATIITTQLTLKYK